MATNTNMKPAKIAQKSTLTLKVSVLRFQTLLAVLVQTSNQSLS